MAKQTGIEFDGVEEMRAAIDNLAGIFPDKVVKAVHLEGEYVMTDSKRNYVPVDLGVLRSSGFVNPPVRSGKEVSVTIGFGGAASAYALAVHEHPSTHSPPSWQGKSVADILSVSNRTPWSSGGCNETRKVSKSHALSVEGLRSMSGTRFICDAAEVNVRRLLADVKHKIDQATTGCILATSESFEG